ncbi:hypothetical protein F4825DRAFT_456289 [Nemania diffusa]|nr:hypothetical protein F4825DRAFT_456289 [Nemania diffusa]
MALGRLDDAWKAASRSTALCQQVHGDKGPLIANCHTTLGWIRKAQGRLDEAEAFFLSALDMYTQSHGDVEEKAVALHNYAAILKSKGDYPSAVSVMKQAVDLLRTMPDASHLLARSLFYLSTYQRDQSGHATNNKLEDEAFSLYKKHVGDSVTKAQAKLTKSDYDNLLIFYFR